MSLAACRNSSWFDFYDCFKIAIFGSRTTISFPLLLSRRFLRYIISRQPLMLGPWNLVCGFYMGKPLPVFFRISIFEFLAIFWLFEKTLSNFRSPHLRYIISRQPFVLGPWNLVCGFYMGKPLPVFFRISIFEFLAIFWLFEKHLVILDRLTLGTSYLGNHWC